MSPLPPPYGRADKRARSGRLAPRRAKRAAPTGYYACAHACLLYPLSCPLFHPYINGEVGILGGSVLMVPVLTALSARASTAPTCTYNDIPLIAPAPVLSTLLHRASGMPMAPQRADSHPLRSVHPLRLTTAALSQIPAQYKGTARYSPLSRLYAGYASSLHCPLTTHARVAHPGRFALRS